MGYMDVVSRVSQIDSMLQQLSDPTAGATSSTGSTTTAAPASASTFSFQSALASAQADPSAAVGAGDGSNAGLRALAIAKSQLGVTEQPPGSNDGPQISMYRSAVAGSYAGAPWCAYFVSWCARQAGEPLGEAGQGFGSVDALYAWAQRAGRAVPNGPGVTPAPGDLIVWGEHVGIVESVDPDGTIHTIEGNSGDAVSRRTYAAGGGGGGGYVRM
jgi:CHAP domain